MKEAGLYRMWIPRAYGGLEVDPMTGVRIVEQVASIASAAAWNLALSFGVPLFSAYFDEQANAEIYAGGDVLAAGTLFPPGAAAPGEGGFRFSGRMSFASGCNHCQWFIAAAHVMDDGKARENEKGQPEPWAVFVPAGDLEIIDHWDTLGMRGTGSHDVAIRDAFPRHRAARLLAPERRTLPKGFEGPLYRCTVWPAVSSLAIVATGIARAAIDELVALASKKTPNYTPSPLRERSVAQFQVARAEAKLGSARAYLYGALQEAWENGVAGRFIDMPQKHKLQLAAANAAATAAEAVDLVHAAAGSSGIREEYPFERHFRDVHSVTQHAFISAARYESVGKPLFGLESDWGFFEF
jgi:alkylation response protein AidB-like acyl-CoA dehydrogenase